MRLLVPFVALLAVLATARSVARADDGAPATFALVVGSNAGGPGQAELRYAEDDARRVAALLVELGGYAPGDVDVALHPTPQAVRDRLTALAARVAAAAREGRPARVFFYYSGHARAAAIDLGPDELPLEELRARLFALEAGGAALTVVVLDACQSGAFSRVKGAEPAADFSFTSRQQLEATGVAVLASSSGSELSQESERLRSSYFTHHLLVALRGAGDANGDGQVSLDEAYRYAYHQTLLATAETAVGGQHVSFEAALKGHGEVPLSFPTRATATIVLPPQLAGRALVEQVAAHAVVAETYKAAGDVVRLAVAPGRYQVLVRSGAQLARCPVETPAAGSVVVDLARCSHERVDVATVAKGGAPAPAFDHAWRFELDGVVGPEHRDAYTQTLINFSYAKDDFAASAGLAGIALRRVTEYAWVGGGLASTGAPDWTRPTDVSPLVFSWVTNTALAIGQLETPLADEGVAHHVAFYARAGLGLGLGRTHYTNVDGKETAQTYLGPAASVGAGMRISSLWLEGVALQLGYQYDYARVIDNEIGDTHASGGHRMLLGLTYSY